MCGSSFCGTIPAPTFILLFFAVSMLTWALTLSILDRWMPAPDLKDGDCEHCGKHQQTYDGLCSDCFDSQ